MLITKENIEEFAKEVTEPLENLFPDLIGTDFFKGPLTREEAILAVNTFFKNTHPAILYRDGEQFFCIYP